MSQKPKSKSTRVSLYQFMDQFDTEEKAMRYLEQCRWHTERRCPRPRCHSLKTTDATHKTMPYWCGTGRHYFSVKTGTLMEGSHLSYRKWLMAIYLMSTSLKGVSSTKLCNDIGVQQRTAWFLAHRIRGAWQENIAQALGMTVEVDETFIGGKEKNKQAKRKLHAGRGGVGRAAIVGIKDRIDKKVKALTIYNTDAPTLQRVVRDHVPEGATVYTDDHRSYAGFAKHGYQHKSVKHSVSEYVNGQAHTNGIESFWSMFKRGYYGVYHHMSVKHLQRYVNEFAVRQ